MKRWFDILVVLVIAIPAILICGALSILVYFIEREDPFFSQTRVGKDESEFTMLKLRTMRSGTVNAGTHEVPKSAITKYGFFMRRFKLDELPQLWNVLVGHMSLVGPRPGLPSQTELSHERRVRGVYSVRPGITGLSQISGIDMSTPIQLSVCDAEYVARQSTFFDFKILYRTFFRSGACVDVDASCFGMGKTKKS